MADNTGLGGPLDGFGAFLTVPEADTQDAIRTGLVVFDTNVLLNLYRYDEAARTAFLQVIERLGERLFIPHQVMTEFWRQRENAVRDRCSMAEKTIEEIEHATGLAEQAVRSWANRSGAAAAVSGNLADKLSSGVDDVISQIREFGETDLATAVKDTSKDTVLTELLPLLEDRVGPALPPDAHDEALAEAKRRIEKAIPPGFKDAKKQGDHSAGDFLVWEQTLLEAARRGAEAQSLVFVTGDTAGDDWYRKISNDLRGPRPELFEEAKLRANARLILLPPPNLLHHAQLALKLDISEDTVASAERVDESAKPPAGSWPLRAIGAFMETLAVTGPVQYRSILCAVANGGVVTRQEVYDIGGYEDDRTLRGFTRPARRVMNEMQLQDQLPDDVQEPLTTLYQAEDSYVLASGFSIPNEFVEALYERLEAG